MTCKDEETDSSNPMKHAKYSMATVKTSCAASLTALLLLWEATLPLQFSWSEAPQCPPAPEGKNSLVLWCDPPPVTTAPISGLKGCQKPFWSTWDKKLLTSPGFPPPTLNSPLCGGQLMTPAQIHLTSTPRSIGYATTDLL